MVGRPQRGDPTLRLTSGKRPGGEASHQTGRYHSQEWTAGVELRPSGARGDCRSVLTKADKRC